MRRQIEGAERWAKEHGLTILDENRLQDLGLSAFSGAAAEFGALRPYVRSDAVVIFVLPFE